ncbi:VOC family protein [Pseudofrankia sp. DC12]|uniref:VOC family protein n=1 Tax=Pseudofrankia sp. DC12 TaxID=683315 RepID=UPI0005F815AD|nr:VOC family protein [Pseudofrankia sp. DC12]
MRVTGFDHLVLNVADAERSLAFYRDVLGLEPVRVEQWRAGEAPFPSVRVNDTTIIDLMELPRTSANVDHFCLVVDPLDWQDIIDTGTVTVVDGPATRFGAQGDAVSLYIKDPDDNTVELRWYPREPD